MKLLKLLRYFNNIFGTTKQASCLDIIYIQYVYKNIHIVEVFDVSIIADNKIHFH